MTSALTVSNDLAREKRRSSLGNRLSKLLEWFAIRGENKKAIAKTKILIGKTTMRIQRRIDRKIAIYETIDVVPDLRNKILNLELFARLIYTI